MKDVALNKEFDINSLFRKLGIVSFKLKELSFTRIKNRDSILRSLSENQSIKSLRTLVNISKPIIINKENSEYKPFSPYVTFSDACRINPPEAIKFNSTILKFIEKPDRQKEESITSLLEKWISNYKKFNRLTSNFSLNELKPHYKNLHVVAKHLKKLLEVGTLADAELLEMYTNLEKLKAPFAQVQIEVVTGLEQLINFALCKNNKS